MGWWRWLNKKKLNVKTILKLYRLYTCAYIILNFNEIFFVAQNLVTTKTLRLELLLFYFQVYNTNRLIRNEAK